MQTDPKDIIIADNNSASDTGYHHGNAGSLAQDNTKEKAQHSKQKKTEKTIQHVTTKNITLPGGHKVIETKTKTVEVKVTETTNVSAEKNTSAPTASGTPASGFESVVDKALKDIIQGKPSKETAGFSNEIKSIKRADQNEPFHLEPDIKSEMAPGLKQNIIDSPEVKSALSNEFSKLDKTIKDSSTKNNEKSGINMTSKKAKFNLTHGDSKKTVTEIDLRAAKPEKKQPDVAFIIVGSDGHGSTPTGLAQSLDKVNKLEAPFPGLITTHDIPGLKGQRDLESALAAEVSAVGSGATDSLNTNNLHPANDIIPSKGVVMDGQYDQLHLDSGERHSDSHSAPVLGGSAGVLIDPGERGRLQHSSTVLVDNLRGSATDSRALGGLLSRLMSEGRQSSSSGGSKDTSSGVVLLPKCLNIFILAPDGTSQQVGATKAETSMSSNEAMSSTSQQLDVGVKLSHPTTKPQSLQLGLSSRAAGLSKGLDVTKTDHTGTHSANLDVQAKSGFVDVNLNDAGYRADAAELGLQTQGLGNQEKFYLLMLGAGPTEKDIASSQVGQEAGPIAGNSLKATKPIGDKTYLAATQDSGIVKAIGVGTHAPLTRETVGAYRHIPFEGIVALSSGAKIPVYAQNHRNRAHKSGSLARLDTTADQGMPPMGTSGSKVASVSQQAMEQGPPKGTNHFEPNILDGAIGVAHNNAVTAKAKKEQIIDREPVYQTLPKAGLSGTDKKTRINEIQTSDNIKKASDTLFTGKTINSIDPILERSVENSLNRTDSVEPNAAKLVNDMSHLSSSDLHLAGPQEIKPADNVQAADTVHQINNSGTLETKEKAALNKTKKAEKTSQQVTKKEIKLPGGENMVETKTKTVEVKVTETTNVTAEKNTSRTDENNKTASGNTNPSDANSKRAASGLRSVVDKALDGIKQELYAGKSARSSHDIKSIKPSDQHDLSRVEADIKGDVAASFGQNIIDSPVVNSALSNGLSKLAKVTRGEVTKTGKNPGINKTSKKAKFNISHGNSKKTVTEIDLTAAKPEKKQPDVAIILVGNDGNGPDSTFEGLAQSLDQVSQSESPASGPITGNEVSGLAGQINLKHALAAEIAAAASGAPESLETINFRPPTVDKPTDISQTISGDVGITLRSDSRPTSRTQRTHDKSRQVSARPLAGDFMTVSGTRAADRPVSLQPVTLFGGDSGTVVSGEGARQTGQRKGSSFPYETNLPQFPSRSTGIPILPESGYLSPDSRTPFERHRGVRRRKLTGQTRQGGSPRRSSGDLNRLSGGMMDEQSGQLNLDSGRPSFYRGNRFSEDNRKSRQGGTSRALDTPSFNRKYLFSTGGAAGGTSSGIADAGAPDVRYVDLRGGTPDSRRHGGPGLTFGSGGKIRGRTQDGRRKLNRESGLERLPASDSGLRDNAFRDSFGRSIRPPVGLKVGGVADHDIFRRTDSRSDVRNARPIWRHPSAASPVAVTGLGTRQTTSWTDGGRTSQEGGDLSMTWNRARAGSNSGQTRARSRLGGRRSLAAMHFGS